MKAPTMNQLYKDLIREVDTNPDYLVSPRGMKIKEKIGLQFRLTNPKECLVSLTNRKLNHAFAVVEKFEYLYGKHNPERLIAYNANLANYRGEYGYFDGNYAERLNFWIRHCYQILKADPDSRQAVAAIYDATARHQSKDIPCTLTLQFFIRGGKLLLMVNMRSNDLLWGTPYDVNAFAFLQEVMASWLGIEMGEYIHTNGSTHIYLEPEKNYQQLLSCLDSEAEDIKNPVFNLTFEETQSALPIFMAAEQFMREGKWREAGVLSSQLPECFDQYLAILQEKLMKRA